MFGHPPTTCGTARCATGLPIDPNTQDACAFCKDHVVIGEQGGAVAVENHAGSDVAKAFKGLKAARHRNHGLLTESRHAMDAAAFRPVALERRCQQPLAITASGVPPIRSPADRERDARKPVGPDDIGWPHFQTIRADDPGPAGAGPAGHGRRRATGQGGAAQARPSFASRAARRRAKSSPA